MRLLTALLFWASGFCSATAVVAAHRKLWPNMLMMILIAILDFAMGVFSL